MMAETVSELHIYLNASLTFFKFVQIRRISVKALLCMNYGSIISYIFFMKDPVSVSLIFESEAR